MNSEQLFETSLKYIPGGVHSPVRSFKGLHTTPRFMQKANGAYITDVDGKEYIDFCMSFGPLIHGHRDEQVESAVVDALKNGWSYGACEPYSLELAQYIVDHISHIDQIRFVNSGTEAVMTALRLARGFTGKNKIIKFNGCYHGHLDSMLIQAGSGLAGETEASSAGVSEDTANDTLICELNNIEALSQIFKEHDDIAGVIIEPLPANNGLLPQDNSFLVDVQKLCKQNNALLIFDEVISGFRVDFEGMAKETNIDPDLVTYGKIIGGGFPVGAVAGKKEIMQKLAPIGDVYQAGTLSANPVAMRAGLVNLKRCTPDFYSQLSDYSQKICSLFTKWLAEKEYSHYKVVQYKSLFWLVPTQDNIKSIDKIPQNLATDFVPLFEELLNKGIYLSPNAYEVGFVSGAHNNDVIDDLKQKLWS